MQREANYSSHNARQCRSHLLLRCVSTEYLLSPERPISKGWKGSGISTKSRGMRGVPPGSAGEEEGWWQESLQEARQCTELRELLELWLGCHRF